MASKSYSKVHPFNSNEEDDIELQSPPHTPNSQASSITYVSRFSPNTTPLRASGENQLGFENNDDLDSTFRGSVKLNKGSLKLSTSSKKVAIEVPRNGTVLSSFPILFNNIMGAGILGLPYAVANTGFGLGSILMLVAGGSALFALHLLSNCSLKMMKVDPAPTFYSVAMTASPKFATMVDIALIIKCFGVATSYQIVIGGLMPDVMAGVGAPVVMQTRQIWIAISTIIIIPLSFMNSLDGLKNTSKASMAFVFFLMFMMIFYVCQLPGMDPCADLKHAGPCRGDIGTFVIQVNTFKVFSIFIFAFNCHQNVFGIVNELKEPTIRKMNAITMLAVGAALVVVLTIACVGYATYGSNVESNVLRNYPNSPLVSIARLFISLLVCFCYPLQCHPARTNMLTFWSSLDPPDHQPDDKTLYFRYLVTTTIFLGVTLSISLSVEDLGVMLSVVGATGSTLVSYILPGFCYYFLFKDEENSEEAPRWKTYAALIQGIIGVIIVPTCLTFALS